jgi:hypothetical protein
MLHEAVTLNIAPARRLRFVAVTLLYLLASCGEGGGTTDPDPAAAAAIAANSQTALSAVAGSAVSPAPSVIVRDQYGAAFPGAQVTFSVESGGGTITGESAVTDASGIATVGSWTLGKTAGPNSLRASSGSLTVTFNATGTAGPTAMLAISTGDNQTAPAGSAVPIPPAVVVQDANGNLKAGVTVTFSISEGGGSLTGATATSNASGIATVGSWTLGPAIGNNALVASTPGAGSVTFKAAASNAKCAARTTHVLGTTSSGALESDDCTYPDGSFVDFYSVTLPGANAYRFRQGAPFDTYLDLSLADGTVIAENDDEIDGSFNSGISALLPAGTYLLGAGSLDPAVTGSYNLSSQVISTDNASCDVWFVIRGVSTTQGIASTDCQFSQPSTPFYTDRYFILLRAGQSVTITMSSSAVDSYLELDRLSGGRVAQNDNRDATTKDARITFTAAATDYYAIFARTAIASQTGAYSLDIQ